MKLLLAVVVFAVCAFGGLTWNRERKIADAYARAKQVYEMRAYRRGSERVDISLLGGAGLDDFDRETPKYIERLKEELREDERRAQMIGYFTSPAGL
jgi:hypothetical protein